MTDKEICYHWGIIHVTLTIEQTVLWSKTGKKRAARKSNWRKTGEHYYIFQFSFLFQQ